MIRSAIKISTAAIVLALIAGIGTVTGQDSETGDSEDLRQRVERQKPGNTTFLMRGYAHAGFEFVDDEATFVSGTFAPIFLWRQSDRILFEAEAEIVYTEEGVDFALEYANLSYILSDYFVVRFGNFLTPFGIFGERLHPNWINRFPTNPLGFDHHNPVGPFAEFGVELRGGAPLGDGQFNYALYLSNGPVLQVDTGVDPITVNTSYRNIGDNNDNKAIGGRIGVLPFSNSSLELGVSGQYAKIGDRDTGFEDIASRMYALDLTYVKNSISAIKGNIDLKAQWNYVDEDAFQLVGATGTTEVDNDKSAYFAMLSYRPSLSGSDFLSKIELVGRYSAFNIINDASFISGGDGHDHTHRTPEEPVPVISAAGPNAFSEATFGVNASSNSLQQGTDEDTTQWAIGINYWLTWRSVLKFSYQVTNSESDVPGFFIHYAIGF
ncbi:MAG: hypothetical protein R3224_01450 [Balneolaceae bacterium]|nr:hypothetical protein [Balneolaceae bacterium]